MTDPHLRLLFQNDLVRVDDYRCDGHDDVGEEYAHDHEIVFLRAGVFLRYDHSGEVLGDVNHVLFFQRHQPYEITHPATGSDCSTIFTLQPALLSEMAASIDPTAQERPERPFPVGYVLMGTRQSLLHYQLLRAVLSGDEPLATVERLLLLLAEVIDAAYQSSPSATSNNHRQTTTRGHKEMVEQAKLVLNARFRDPLKLEEVARDVHTSPYHLCRIFRQFTGLPIHQYLQRIRLLHALEHLAEAHADDLTHTALSLGFSSHSHFTTAFRQTFDLTPSQFRQRVSFRSVRQMSKNLKA
jgi:AraC-like DNA-binding protein